MGTMSALGLNLQPLNHYLKNPPCNFNKLNKYNSPSSCLNFSSKLPKLGVSSKKDFSFKKVVCFAVEDATETTSQLQGVIFTVCLLKFLICYDELHLVGLFVLFWYRLLSTLLINKCFLVLDFVW